MQADSRQLAIEPVGFGEGAGALDLSVDGVDDSMDQGGDGDGDGAGARAELAAREAEAEQLHDRLDEAEMELDRLRARLAELKAGLGQARSQRDVYKEALEEERARASEAMGKAEHHARDAVRGVETRWEQERLKLLDMLKEAKQAAREAEQQAAGHMSRAAKAELEATKTRVIASAAIRRSADASRRMQARARHIEQLSTRFAARQLLNGRARKAKADALVVWRRFVSRREREEARERLSRSQHEAEDSLARALKAERQLGDLRREVESESRRRRAAIRAALLARIDFTQPGAVEAAVAHYQERSPASLKEDEELTEALGSVGAEVDARVFPGSGGAVPVSRHPRLGERRFDPHEAAEAVARRAVEYDEADAAHAAAAAAAQSASASARGLDGSFGGRKGGFDLPPPGRRGRFSRPAAGYGSGSINRDGASSGSGGSVGDPVDEEEQQGEFCGPLAPSSPFVLSLQPHSRGAVLDRVAQLSAAVDAEAERQVGAPTAGTVAPLADRIRAAESAVSARIARADQRGEAVGVAYTALHRLIESVAGRHGARSGTSGPRARLGKSGASQRGAEEDGDEEVAVSMGRLPAPTAEGLWSASRRTAERAALAEQELRDRAAAARAAVVSAAAAQSSGTASIRAESAAAVAAETKRRQAAAEQAVLKLEQARRDKEQTEAAHRRLLELQELAQQEVLRARSEAAQAASDADAARARGAAGLEERRRMLAEAEAAAAEAGRRVGRPTVSVAAGDIRAPMLAAASQVSVREA